MTVRVAIVAALTVMVLTGCAQISVHQADGTVTQENRFGAVTIRTEPGKQPILFRAQGVGIVTTGDRFTLGYVDADYAVLPLGDCRIVIWMDAGMKAQALDAVRNMGDQVCLAGPGASDFNMKGE
jgi:hypothetical protein